MTFTDHGGPAAILQDEQSSDNNLICSIAEDEFVEVRYLYRVGNPIRAFGAYMDSVNGMPVFGNCELAGPTETVVRP